MVGYDSGRLPRSRRCLFSCGQDRRGTRVPPELELSSMVRVNLQHFIADAFAHGRRRLRRDGLCVIGVSCFFFCFFCFFGTDVSVPVRFQPRVFFLLKEECCRHADPPSPTLRYHRAAFLCCVYASRRGSTRIKYMTDGVLLREAMSDPLLSAYSAIVLDEVSTSFVQRDRSALLCRIACPGPSSAPACVRLWTQGRKA